MNDSPTRRAYHLAIESSDNPFTYSFNSLSFGFTWFARVLTIILYNLGDFLAVATLYGIFYGFVFLDFLHTILQFLLFLFAKVLEVCPDTDGYQKFHKRFHTDHPTYLKRYSVIFLSASVRTILSFFTSPLYSVNSPPNFFIDSS